MGRDRYKSGNFLYFSTFMNKEEALELIDRLGGDEQAWVDLKSDYYIKGNHYLETEFVKDVQSLANVLDAREDRYLLIGCEEDGGVVGVSEGAEDEDADTRHLLSFEADDLQDIIDSRLSPGPQLSLHSFVEDGSKFAVLVVNRVKKPLGLRRVSWRMMKVVLSSERMKFGFGSRLGKRRSTGTNLSLLSNID